MNHMQTNSKSNTTAFFPRISQLTTTAVVVATLRSIALVTVVGLTGLSSAFAQTGGEIIWSVDLTQTARTAAPRVAPSGDIYIHSDDLYAISSTGQIKWRKNSVRSKGGGCRA